MKTLLIALCLAFLTSPGTSASDSPIVKHKMNLLSTNMFTGCTNETLKSNQIFLLRSEVAGASGSPEECIDKSTEVHDIQPSEVGVMYEKNIDVWSAYFLVDKSDALKIEKIFRNGIGHELVVCVGGKVVASAVMNGLFTGNRFEMTRESKQAAHNLSMAFVAPKDRW